jgi:serine phosphatase RsbU (regulator of sigma subunit)
MTYAKEINYKELQLDIAANLIDVCDSMGELKESIGYSKFYINLKDSLSDADTRQQFAEMQAKLDNTVQKNEIEILQKNKLIDAEKDRRKNLIIYFGAGAIILFSVLLIIIFRGYNQKKKINIVITEQKKEVELQRNIVELKNREIVDSINYAQRIQQAILLPESEIQKEFSEAFILFKPKDIVSGDFYWFAESTENKILALADCTGHGVPGGFMSMLGFEILQDVMLREEIHTTSEALKFLDKKVTDTLNKNSKSYRDGMDMALCAFNKISGKLSFSGANRPLIYISNGVITTYKPDKHTIGGAIDDVEKIFTQVEIDVHKGDLIYLFTDGYADQFGGASGKKFKYKQFSEKLLEISDKNLAEQKEILEKTFEDWKGNLEQVDDVCVIGIRI